MALKDEKIQERWEALIEQGQGQADTIFQAATEYLERAEPPEVRWERRDIRAGGLLSGKKYDFLYARNRHLNDFRLYLTAYDYGTSLHVAWFLTIELPWWKRIVGTILFWTDILPDPKDVAGAGLDIPKQLELSAYAITLHTAAKRSVKVLMEKLEQDFSKVDTKSKGFLQLW